MASTPSTSKQAEAFPNGTTDYKPLRAGSKYDPKRPHISDLPMTWKNWHQHVNWLNTILIVIVPIVGLISTYWVRANWKTVAFAVFYYFHCGLGITAGKSELFSDHAVFLQLLNIQRFS